ncbi:DUF1990 family protein [Nocardioides alkalitolerans]|uniref:DUF1990 family protein n=1 Tax=Nocardioides alkalitolerans TaxID=281714 RepID=UPI0009FD469A|nr:DUF1990 domain-containing protein [Nocardioides alkalitolerans]
MPPSLPAPLPAARAAALRAAPWTYAQVGLTLAHLRDGAPLPERHHQLDRSRPLGYGAATYGRAVEDLFTWQVQRRAGLDVRADARADEPGAVALLTIGPWPFVVRAPVRVVDVLAEPTRAGFSYGTLPGHPERGEESFVVSIDDAGAVRLTVTAFSRGGPWWARLGAPVASYVQKRTTDRYLAALVTPVTPSTAP